MRSRGASHAAPELSPRLRTRRQSTRVKKTARPIAATTSDNISTLRLTPCYHFAVESATTSEISARMRLFPANLSQLKTHASTENWSVSKHRSARFPTPRDCFLRAVLRDSSVNRPGANSLQGRKPYLFARPTAGLEAQCSLAPDVGAEAPTP